MDPTPRPRLLCVVEGHPATTLSGIPVCILEALGEHLELAGWLDYGLKGPRRLAVAAAAFAPDRARWRARFHTGLRAQHALSAEMGRQTSRLERPFDVALQIHGWALGQPHPYTLYADPTRAMAERGFPSWLPLAPRERAEVLDREREMYRLAAHLFVMGAPTRQSLVEDYDVDPARVTVVGGGLNMDSVPTPRPPTLDPVVLFVGREFERKGGPVLLEAFEEVRSRLPAARLEIVGPRLRVAAPGVTVHGLVRDRDRLMQLYRGARVFCMPSLYEPWGFVFTEALALGVPCVGTEVQSIPHILGDGEGGLVVPPVDTAALAEALMRVLTDDDLATALSRGVRRLVEDGFTWRHVAARMAPALRDAARAGGA